MCKFTLQRDQFENADGNVLHDGEILDEDTVEVLIFEAICLNKVMRANR
jgi:hypothetical protein